MTTARQLYHVADLPDPPETTDVCDRCAGEGRLPGDEHACPDCDGTGEIDLVGEANMCRLNRDELLRGGGSE